MSMGFCVSRHLIDTSSISTHILAAFQEYVILPEPPKDGIWRVLENKEGLPWSVYVGVAGMPGGSGV